ncbi:hypothetical protein PInf_029016 [Phytophthora infestans]|nr:hypothetical protein PInf_029016 [Phytophthora infestans]
MYNDDFLDDIRQALCTSDGPDRKLKDPFTGLTPEVYATFWGLKLYDIHIRSSSTSRKSFLKEKTTQMIDVLTTEQKEQVAHRKRVYERLEKMKSKFF